MERRTILLVSVLAISLLANVFAAGFLLMPRFSHDQRLARIGAMAAVGKVSDDAREWINAQIEKDRDTIRSRWRDVRTSRRAVREAMRADPFDAAALDAAFAELRAKSGALQDAVHTSVAQAIASAPSDVRAGFREREDDEPKTDRAPQ